LGVGDWRLGFGPNPQSPIPNPQSPIPNPQFIYKMFFSFYLDIINNIIIILIKYFMKCKIYINAL